MISILIVEDDKILRQTLARMFTNKGYLVEQADDVPEATQFMEREIFNLVLTDLRLGKGTGLEVLEISKKLSPETGVIIMTAYGTVDTAVKAIQNGAADYVTKPFKNDELLVKIEMALEQINLRSEIRYLRREIAQKYGFDNIIGISRAINDLKKIIDRISGTDIAVLITGESGTGKELVAKVLHHHSLRRSKPFVPINCTAIPENLLESELFGHVKGAFTSAVANKRGLFDEAEQGTIFLDEVGDLPFSIQAKLLRVLQEKEIRPVGGNKTHPIDVRVIAATNADLNYKVQSGQFREDLFYRLNVMPIHISPLRERPEDIPALTEYFLRKIQHEYDISGLSLTADSMELFLRHNWPGNVRELENTLKRAVALSGGRQIRYEDVIFISGKQKESSKIDPIKKPRSLKEAQKLQILKSLEENDWNFTMTANQLGIGRTTLWRKVKKYDLKAPVEAG